MVRIRRAAGKLAAVCGGALPPCTEVVGMIWCGFCQRLFWDDVGGLLCGMCEKLKADEMEEGRP